MITKLSSHGVILKKKSKNCQKLLIKLNVNSHERTNNISNDCRLYSPIATHKTHINIPLQHLKGSKNITFKTVM